MWNISIWALHPVELLELEAFDGVDRQYTHGEFAYDVSGVNWPKQAGVQRVAAVVAHYEYLVVADSPFAVYAGAGDNIAVGQRFVWVKAVRVCGVVHHYFAAAYHNFVAGQANNAFNKLFVWVLAEFAKASIGKHYYVAPLRDVCMVRNFSPGACQFPYDEAVVVVQGGFHAGAVYLVRLEHEHGQENSNNRGDNQY